MLSAEKQCRMYKVSQSLILFFKIYLIFLDEYLFHD